MKIARVLVVLPFFALFFAFNGRTADAQTADKQAQALAVSPAIIEEVLEPGSKTEGSVLVTNIANVPVPIKASVAGFVPNEELPADPEGIYRAQSWFDIEEPDFILQPRESHKVEYTITTPEQASPGGHYATIYFQSLIPAEAVSEERLYLSGRIGVLAFLVVKGDIVEKGRIEDFSADRFQSGDTVGFDLAIKNQGNVHLLPSGSVYIYDWHGKQIAKLPLKPGMVLPGTARVFKLEWKKDSRRGKFTANAELTYGSDGRTLKSREVTFYAIPSLSLIITVALVIIAAIPVYFGRRRILTATRILAGRNTYRHSG